MTPDLSSHGGPVPPLLEMIYHLCHFRLGLPVGSPDNLVGHRIQAHRAAYCLSVPVRTELQHPVMFIRKWNLTVHSRLNSQIAMGNYPLVCTALAQAVRSRPSALSRWPLVALLNSFAQAALEARPAIETIRIPMSPLGLMLHHQACQWASMRIYIVQALLKLGYTL